MTTATHAPIKRAFVQRIRANGDLYVRFVGGVHEGFAPEKAKYPFLVYNLVAAPYDYQWGSHSLLAMIDAFVFSRDSVEANNLDEDVTAWLSDQPYPVDGQKALICRRVATVPMPPDVDDEGQKVYQVGGTYQIETDAGAYDGPRVFSRGALDSVPGLIDTN